jgi:putative hemolysin
MKLQTKAAIVLGALALATAPALALADPPATNPGQGNGPHYQPEKPEKTPGPNASLPEKANAYGVYCQKQGFSKKHVKGQKGTPFSQCVTAAAKAATSDQTTAKEACKAFPKKHVKGQKGTPFSRCVVAAAQAKKAAAQV